MFVAHRRYYAFLTRLEGDANGPFVLSFDCTAANWFDDVIENRLPPNYRVDRLELLLAGRDYLTAWDSSVGIRVPLRHMFENYRAIVGSSDNPVQLATLDITLTRADFTACEVPPIGGQPRSLVEGMWYGLELAKYSAQVVPPPEAGALSICNPQTDEMADAEPWRLVSFHYLRTAPSLVPVMFGSLFRSQAVLQALHYARGE